jgi:hypothetical protein
MRQRGNPLHGTCVREGLRNTSHEEHDRERMIMMIDADVNDADAAET